MSCPDLPNHVRGYFGSSGEINHITTLKVVQNERSTKLYFLHVLHKLVKLSTKMCYAPFKLQDSLINSVPEIKQSIF